MIPVVLTFSPTAEAPGGAGEVLIWKIGVVCHLGMGLTAEAIGRSVPSGL